MSKPISPLELCSNAYDPTRYEAYPFMWMPTCLLRASVSNVKDILTSEIDHLHFTNDMEPTRDALRYLRDHLFEFPNITSVTIEGHHLGDKGLEILAPALSNSETIQTIKLRGTRITDHGCQDLCTVLQSNRVLRHLDLTGNLISPHGAHLLSEGLAESQLVELNLQCNPIFNTHNSSSEDDVIPIIDFLPASLQLLDLSRCQLGDAGAKQIARVIRGTNLKFLRLECNYITEVGLKVLTQAVHESTVRGLDLEFNYIYNGIHHLSKLLSQLTYLNLTLTYPRKDGLKLFVEELKAKSCTVQELKLDQCGLGGSVNKTTRRGVTTITLEGRVFPILLNPLIDNTSLTHLSIRTNALNPDDVRELATGMQNTNPTISIDFGKYFAQTADYHVNEVVQPLLLAN